MHKRLILPVIFTLLVPGAASAGSCLPFLQPQPSAVPSFYMATLNKNGVASYATGRLTLARGGPRPLPRWVASGAPQLFSDRRTGANGAQPFSIGKADKIGLGIGISAAPAVQITLESWSGAKSNFVADCSAGGVMHGSTPDVDYLIVVFQSIVR